MANPARYSHRRPRYYDGEESDSTDADNYRPRHRDDRRAPPPPAPAPAPKQVRRPSILVDPDETASDRARRRPRSSSNVRLQASDDDYDDPRGAPRSRRGPPPDSRHDLEAKDTDTHRQFREKRDGYTSDEGERLRAAKQAPPQPRGYPDDDGDYGRQRAPERSLPLRGKPRAPADSVEYGGADVPAEPRVMRRRTYKEPSSRDRPSYDQYDAPSPRRQDRRRTTDYDDPGYGSDHGRRPPPRRRERPRREYDDDDYDRPRRRPDDRAYRSGGDRPQRPRPQDYYSDSREDRAPRRGDPRRRPRDDRNDDRYDDRYDDRRRADYDYDRPRRSDSRRQTSRSGSGGMKDWQKEASAAFMTYAMPMIKKEGTKYVKEGLQKFLASKGGA